LKAERYLRNWPHNILLEILAEYGILGMIVFGLILLGALQSFYVIQCIGRIKCDENIQAELIMIGALLIYSLVAANFSFSFEQHPTLWLALGLLSKLSFEARSSLRSRLCYATTKTAFQVGDAHGEVRKASLS
jgi:O-antigen ligase